MASETYISIDTETTGPCPGINSMLSLGAAVFYADGSEGPTFYATLKELSDGNPYQPTLDWWRTQPKAYKWATDKPSNPELVMADFVQWCREITGRKVPVAWPAAFDFGFVNYYCWRFAGENPLGFGCMDLRSLVMGLHHTKGYYNLKDAKIKELAGR